MLVPPPKGHFPVEFARDGSQIARRAGHGPGENTSSYIYKGSCPNSHTLSGNFSAAAASPMSSGGMASLPGARSNRKFPTQARATCASIRISSRRLAISQSIQKVQNRPVRQNQITARFGLLNGGPSSPRDYLPLRPILDNGAAQDMGQDGCGGLLGVPQDSGGQRPSQSPSAIVERTSSSQRSQGRPLRSRPGYTPRKSLALRRRVPSLRCGYRQ
jgi:hypothetical protein